MPKRPRILGATARNVNVAATSLGKAYGTTALSAVENFGDEDFGARAVAYGKAITDAADAVLADTRDVKGTKIDVKRFATASPKTRSRPDFKPVTVTVA